MTIIANFFGGPCVGKSVMTSALFTELKCRGLNAELALEYVKGKVYEKSLSVLENQIYVFGKQFHIIRRLLGIDVIITDAPLLMSIHYGTKESFAFKALVLEQHSKLNNLNIFLERKHAYNPIGRIHTKEEAEAMDKQMKDMLISNNIDFITMPADINVVKELADMIEKEIRNAQRS